MRISKGCLFLAFMGVRHCHLHFGRDSKAGRRMGKFGVKKKVYPDWRWLTWGSWRWLTRSRTSYVLGRCADGAFSGCPKLKVGAKIREAVSY